MSGLPCPNCGGELSFLEQYHRQYCYSCGHYAPEGYGDRGEKQCATCGGLLSYVAQYDRYYCYRCNTYPPDEAVAEPMGAAIDPASAPPTPGAGAAVVVVEPAKTKTPKVETVEVPSPAAPPEEEPVEDEIPEESAEPAAKPPLVRDEILDARKPVLLDLCKAYDLDPTGTKEQLRERLLSYLDELDEAAEPEVGEPSGDSEMPATLPEPAPVEPAGHEETMEPEPVVEAAPTPQLAAFAQAAPTPQIIQEPPSVIDVTQPEPVVTVPETPVIRPGPRIEHPCPTCGCELAYISQYNRWYCYNCRTYAPLVKPKNACPNCGATLRWIESYERWWCDSCRRYAPADLPKPERAPAAQAVVVEKPVAQPALQPATVLVHRHSSPGSGIGLMGFGIVLFVLHELLVDFPAVLPFNTGIAVSPDVAWGLRFFAFIFVAGGSILGLAALRDRH